MWGIKDKTKSPSLQPLDKDEAELLREKMTSGESFEDVAQRLSEPARTPEAGADVGAGKEKLIIRQEWGKASLEFCFLPLAKLDHPAWALTEEEATNGAPAMQAFLQSIVDKIAPALLARVVNRYPEFVDLTAMLAVLYFQKFKQVRALKLAEMQQPENLAIPVDGIRPVSIADEGFECETCRRHFPTREAALQHLPCPEGVKN